MKFDYSEFLALVDDVTFDFENGQDYQFDKQDILLLKSSIREIKRLRKGIEDACYHLANEDISDEYVVGQIHKELIELVKGEDHIK